MRSLIIGGPSRWVSVATVTGRSAVWFIFRLPSGFERGFDGCVSLQDRLLDSLRRCCRSLPDQRRGLNATYDMADFALAGFAPFFMQSPSFLAHQRHLETGHGRSNCQTLFGMRKIPGDSQIRAKLDAIADSDEGGHQFQFDRGHHSNLMAARL